MIVLFRQQNKTCESPACSDATAPSDPATGRGRSEYLIEALPYLASASARDSTSLHSGVVSSLFIDRVSSFAQFWCPQVPRVSRACSVPASARPARPLTGYAPHGPETCVDVLCTAVTCLAQRFTRHVPDSMGTHHVGAGRCDALPATVWTVLQPHAVPSPPPDRGAPAKPIPSTNYTALATRKTRRGRGPVP